MLDQLIAYGKRTRPDVKWDDILQETDADAPPSKSRAQGRQRRSKETGDAQNIPSPVLFYLMLDGDPQQNVDWSGWFSALAQLGAYGIIVPLIQTPGQWPHDLARYFLDEFLGGQPIGAALRRARQTLFEKCGNPLGLMYAHLGIPDLRLQSPKS